MKKGVTPIDVAEKLYTQGYKFISGKFFDFNGIEVKNFKKSLYTNTAIRPVLQSDKDTQAIADTFIEMFGEVGDWYPLPIIKEAEALKDEDLKPLAFPLSIKQLLIIKVLLTGNNEETFFILTGIGGSGKSTFANIIKQIFDNDVAPLTLQQLSGFELALGANKRLIYADELNSDDLNNGSIKTIVSNQEITINPKNEKPYQMRWQGKLLFSCNKPPRLDLSDSGIVRRITYFHMDTKIKNPDPSLQKKIYTHDDLVNIVAHALRVDSSHWKDAFKFETREILRSTNSVWLCRNKVIGLENTTYDFYTTEAKDKGLKAFSEPKFQDIKDLFLSWDKEEDDDLPF